MKLRFGLYILVLAFCVALLLWHWKNTKTENQSLKPTNQAFSTNTEIPNSQSTNQIPTPSVQISSNIVQSNSQSRIGMFKEALEQKNVPVAFYGQVIDQDSNALSGVKINVYVRHWELTGNALSRPIYLEKETDADGRFEINGETGDALDLESIQKDGYEAEPSQRSYGAVGGSFENPIFFKMWSTNIHEQLITGEKKFQIVPDGRAYFINLTDGTIAESGEGDLKVWVQYTNQITRDQLYDWSSEIDVINGGLLEETDLNSAMYSAPADGYMPSFKLQQQIKGGQSGETGTHRFYATLKNGQEFGRITIDLYAPYNNQIPGLIHLSYVVNPSGSRVLR
jgi:hypothetical protein